MLRIMKSFVLFITSKKFIITCLSILLIGIIVLISINVYILNMSSSFIFQNIEDVPKKQVALVLGAKVYQDGTMSSITSDRADTAIELYNNGKVEKILVSGDHGRQNYDEVNTIKNYLVNNHIPAKDIFLDHAGFDTYDSLFRARDIFHVSSAIIISQNFHLPRAVYIGKSLGLDVVGMSADKHLYVLATYNELREALARFKAFIDITFQVKPKFLGNPIPITGESKVSWD